MNFFQQGWGNALLKEFIEVGSPALTSWWPQTLGWKIVLAILLLLVIKKSYLRWQAYKHNTYRREALAWLNNLPTLYDLEQQTIFRQLPALLRKTAITAFNREQICKLQANEWDAWLDKHCQQTSFTTRFAKQLHILAFSPTPQLSHEQMHALINEVSLWIKFHRRLND